MLWIKYNTTYIAIKYNVTLKSKFEYLSLSIFIASRFNFKKIAKALSISIYAETKSNAIFKYLNDTRITIFRYKYQTINNMYTYISRLIWRSNDVCTSKVSGVRSNIINKSCYCYWLLTYCIIKDKHFQCFWNLWSHQLTISFLIDLLQFESCTYVHMM